MRKIIIVILLLVSVVANSQSTRYWRKTIGLPGPTSWDQGQSIKQLSSGEYLVACNKGGIGSSTAYMLKLDAYGNILSRTDFNDTINSSVYFYMNLVDSGAIVAGWHRTLIPSIESPLIMKTDFNGDSVWTKVINSNSNASQLRYIKGTKDGGFIATGHREQVVSNWNTLILRLDSLGQVLWDSVYVWPFYDSGFHIEEKANGNFVLSGVENFIVGNIKGYLQEIDPNGNLIWHQMYQFPGDTNTAFGSFKIASNGDYVVVGTSGFSPFGDFSIIARMDSAGNPLWMKKFINSLGQFYTGEASRLILLPDNKIVGCGTMYHNYNAFYSRMTLFKTDENGNLLWIRFFTQDPTHDFYAYDVDTTSDGGFVISGRRDSLNTSYAYVVKTNCLGFINKPSADFNVIWNGSTATFYNLSDRADTCIYHFGDGDSMLVQLTDTVPVVHTYSGSGPWIAYLVATACGESDTLFMSVTTGFNDLSYLMESSLNVYPNPASNQLLVELNWPQTFSNVTVTISDFTGRSIKEETLAPGRRTHEFDITSLSAGTYLLVFRASDSKSVFRKIVVSK